MKRSQRQAACGVAIQVISFRSARAAIAGTYEVEPHDEYRRHMGLMERFFGRQGAQAEVEPVLFETRRRTPQTDSRPWDGRTRVEVAGESYHQDELVNITGRRGSEAVKLEDVDLDLIREPDNEHDPQPVKVLAQGLHVGYLSRGNARTYCKRIERQGGRVTLKGFIGCSKGGPIGVRVHIPDDHPIGSHWPERSKPWPERFSSDAQCCFAREPTKR